MLLVVEGQKMMLENVCGTKCLPVVYCRQGQKPTTAVIVAMLVRIVSKFKLLFVLKLILIIIDEFFIAPTECKRE